VTRKQGELIKTLMRSFAYQILRLSDATPHACGSPRLRHQHVFEPFLSPMRTVGRPSRWIYSLGRPPANERYAEFRRRHATGDRVISSFPGETLFFATLF